VFCEGFIEVLDGGSQVTSLGVSSSNATISLCNEFVVRPNLERWVDQLA